MVTSEMVLAEVLAALAAPPARAVIAGVVQRVMGEPNTDVVPQTGLLFREAFALYGIGQTSAGAILPLIFTNRLCDVFDDEVNRIAREIGSRAKAFKLVNQFPVSARLLYSGVGSHNFGILSTAE